MVAIKRRIVILRLNGELAMTLHEIVSYIDGSSLAPD
jgi:hypothetical protein